MATQITVANAESLDSQWTSLANKFDQYYTDLKPEISDQIQRAIGDWQDWFFGNYEMWGPISNLDKWKDILSKTNKLLDEAIAKGLEAKAPVDVEPEEKIVSDEPIFVYGRVPVEPTIYDPDAEKLVYTTPTYEQLNGGKAKKNVLPWVFGGILAAIALKQLAKN